MEHKYYNIFLDDERYPKDVTWVDLPLVEWTIVRSYNDFVKLIEQNGLPASVSFDHDLADEHYRAYIESLQAASPEERRINYDELKEKTGYDCAKYLADYCIDKRCQIPVYYVHTMNPIGRGNICQLLECAKNVIEKL